MLGLNVSSSLTSSSSRWFYAVFLSFKGEDTRYKFVGHLYTAMRQRGIVPIFKDDEKLQRGETISPTLLKAIEESKVYVVVLSENYANSRWCLDELMKILECKNALGERIVYPIFYEVNPSEVRNQTGRFGQGFEELLCSRNYDAEKVQKWKEALKEVSNLSGSEYPRTIHLYESKFIQGVIGSCDVRVIGIWGMGGIGKTTIASIVYNHLSHQFEGSSFLENVRENSESTCGVRALQKQFISDVSKEENLRAQNVSGGSSMIMNMIRNRRILIILDDVDQLIQVEKLIGSKHHLKLGSRIIITTRDKRVLIAYNADDIYMVEEFSDNESIQLFISKAFGEGQLEIGFEKLVRRAVRYAGGIPLALKVLGSFLKGRSKEEWVSALNRLEKWPEESIMRVLRISYEGLEEPEQEIFLEIACFLSRWWNKHNATRILDSYGLYAEIGIGVLVDKSLINVSNNHLDMHDLIVELAQDIVRHESKEAGNRSRLWDSKDIKHVLTENTGTEALKSIRISGTIGKIGPMAFANMTKLRFLEIEGAVELPDGLKYLSNEMRYLNWYKYPLSYLPQKFNPEHLVELHMRHSSLERFWEEEVRLDNLKRMNLCSSKYLVNTPNFTGITNLEELSFSNCKRLKEIHPSIGVLKKLYTLDVGGCINLRSFPPGTKFASLQFLSFYGCQELMNIPESLMTLKLMDVPYLEKFEFSGTTFGQLVNFKGFTYLSELELWECNLENVPSFLYSLLPSLFRLDLSGNNFKSLPANMNQLSRLGTLRLRGCNMLEELPELTPGILKVDATYCKSLRTICNPRIYGSYKEFRFANCSNLIENLEENILRPLVKEQFEVRANEWFENYYYGRDFCITFPGEEIPEWFSHGGENGCSGSYPVPQNSNQEEVVGAAFCLVFDSDSPIDCIHCSDSLFSLDSPFYCKILTDGEFFEREDFEIPINFNFRELKSKTILIQGFFFKPRLVTTFGKKFQYHVEYCIGRRGRQCNRVKQIGVRLIFNSRKEGDSSGNGMNDNDVTSLSQKRSSSYINNKEEDIPKEKRSKTH